MFRKSIIALAAAAALGLAALAPGPASARWGGGGDMGGLHLGGFHRMAFRHRFFRPALARRWLLAHSLGPYPSALGSATHLGVRLSCATGHQPDSNRMVHNPANNPKMDNDTDAAT
jgi:hypothetical protein